MVALQKKIHNSLKKNSRKLQFKKVDKKNYLQNIAKVMIAKHMKQMNSSNLQFSRNLRVLLSNIFEHSKLSIKWNYSDFLS